jgi:hypothetical protein
MGLSNIATAVSVFLAGLLPASCHKTAPQQKVPAASQAVAGTASTNTVLHDLGEVALTNHYETCVRLGGGKDCILSPKLLDGKNIQITFALESRTQAGKIHDLTVAQAAACSGKPMEVAIGDFNLTLTPKIVE